MEAYCAIAPTKFILGDRITDNSFSCMQSLMRKEIQQLEKNSGYYFCYRHTRCTEDRTSNLHQNQC